MNFLRGHPNVITLIDYKVGESMVRRSTGEAREVVVVVLELAEQGELFDYMSFTGPFQEPIARYYFRQLLEALRACHTSGVYHRDLKPENLLLTDDFTLKVADFGLSGILVEGSGAPTKFHTECGTSSYMAPEILRRRPYSGDKADIWSAGVVLFITVCGFPPMKQASPRDWWYDRIREGRMELFWAAHERSFRFSPEFKALINRIFVDKPDERASLEDIMRDPWVNGDVPSNDEVREELTRRSETVEAKREEERRAAEIRAAARAEKVGRGGMDVFETDTVRGAGAAIVPGPEPPAHVYNPHNMYVAGTAEEVVHMVQEELEKMGASVKLHAEQEGEVFLMAHFEGDHIRMRTDVFESKPMLYTFRGIKTEGDMLRFAQLFEDLKDRVYGQEEAAVPAE